ncbi:YihY/virulence factor BrkB family protein [Roseiarcaceae bacterium H3SJ34-1]|uniref:YihY/virulence factor BrkB family protein n=1 Tax=Terripilifer ovatus TaxID=3032367 RepID=UPI003AB937BD|nr:YihY/virulence factor BrkB family protein [Roseiarcaceae bacterium H3SJ34-1]
MPKLISLLRTALDGFLENEALTRGAAIAFYAVTSMAPLLLIVIAIAGLVFGQEAAQTAMLAQLADIAGDQSSEFFQAVIRNAGNRPAGVTAAVTGAATLILTATGVFGEIQSALNTIWKVETKTTALSRFVRARAASAGLVAVLGFLLIVSLTVSAALTALGAQLDTYLSWGKTLIYGLNTSMSFILITLLFAAIYKVLPDRTLTWRDVVVGAAVTSGLFSVGKIAIGWYLGSAGIASTYGAAGAFVLLALWVYYSVMIFLLGAEITKAFAISYGSKRGAPIMPKTVHI